MFIWVLFSSTSLFPSPVHILDARSSEWRVYKVNVTFIFDVVLFFNNAFACRFGSLIIRKGVIVNDVNEKMKWYEGGSMNQYLNYYEIY